jgi:hypothetical protein
MSSLFARGNEQYVISTNSNLALYANRERDPNEQALVRVTPLDLLEVVKVRTPYFLLETRDGTRGWVKQWLVKPYDSSNENALTSAPLTKQNSTVQ